MESREQLQEDTQGTNGVQNNVLDGDLALNKAHIPIAISTGLEIPGEYAEKQNTTKQASLSYLVVKRCFDFLSSFCVSFVLLLPMAILSLIIMIKDPGNPFYIQKRVGKNGKVLRIVKFRSMKKGADNLEKMLSSEQLEEYRREYKLEDDPRLIGWEKSGDSKRCFGSFIRRASLDELPQIVWNICIKGNMSVVGPRPILQEELELNYTLEQQRLILSAKPGLTGYWQAYARNDATYETGERQRMELYYVMHRSLWLDVKILFATIGAVLGERGAK